jgi:hypothetical protein
MSSGMRLEQIQVSAGAPGFGVQVHFASSAFPCRQEELKQKETEHKARLQQVVWITKWGEKSTRCAKHVAAGMISERRLCAGRVVPQQRHPMGGSDMRTPKLWVPFLML